MGGCPKMMVYARPYYFNYIYFHIVIIVVYCVYHHKPETDVIS